MRWGVVVGAAVLAVVVMMGVRIATNRGAEGGVDLALSRLPPGWSARHGTIDFSAVSGTAHMPNLVVAHDGVTVLTAGMVDVAGIGSIAGGVPTRVEHVTLTDVSAPPVLRHVDRVEVDGLATATLRDLLDRGAYPGGKPAWADRRPLLDSMQAFGAALHFAGGGPDHDPPIEVTVVHWRLDDVRARQFAAPAPPRLAVALLRAASFHNVLVEGVAADLPGVGTFRIGTDRAEGYADGRLENYTQQDVSLRSVQPRGEAKLAELTLTGLDFSGLEPDAPAAGALRIGGIRLHGLTMDFARAPLVTLAAIDTHTDYVGADMANGGGTLRDLAIVTTGRDLSPPVRAGLDSFGMADFHVDAAFDTSFDHGTGHFVIKKNDLVFKELGTLHVTADIDGLRLDQMQNRPDAAASLQDARLIHAEMVWDDASLTSRLFRLMEMRTGQTEEVLRASIAFPLVTATAFFPEQPDVADQVNAFLDGRHRLTVTLAPATPVRLLDVNAAAANEKAQMLGITIHGN